MSINYAKLLVSLEETLRQGQIALAENSLRGINASRVPREFLGPMAKMCRRAGLIHLGLKLLTPIVLRKLGKNIEPATPAELTEYGVLLHRQGCSQEALSCLASVPQAKSVDAALYLGFCHFSQWEYSEAIPHLRSYLTGDLSDYARLIGQVNLCAAFAMTRKDEECLDMLDRTLHAVQAAKHNRLWANCLELRAQVQLQNGRFSEAKRDLDRALELMSAGKVHDVIFIRKWLAVIAANQANDPGPLETLALEASNLEWWETARDLALQRQILFPDEVRLKHLVFGTPFHAFRERVYRELGIAPRTGVAVLGGQADRLFDVELGQVNGVGVFKPGCKSHQLLEVLLRDLYSPQNIGGLFSQLFPGDQFDIFSSPQRVHKIIGRAREWLREHDLPITLSAKENWYSLKIEPGLAVCVPLERRLPDWHEVKFKHMLNRFGAGTSVTPNQVMNELELSSAEYKRLLKWARGNHRLQFVGKGRRSSAYRIAG